jgi:hypothetical protein
MMRMIREQIVSLAVLLLALSGMALRATTRVAITMGVLWLVGVLYPHVAAALGLPFDTVYDVATALVESIQALIATRFGGST